MGMGGGGEWGGGGEERPDAPVQVSRPEVIG